ncbi:MAG: GspE/PulE family protein [Gemmatimonadaceae bacterium]
MAPRARIGERLLQAGLINQQQLDKGLQVHAATGEQLGKTLVKLGYLDDDSLVRTLCADAGIPYITMQDVTLDPAAVASLPGNIAAKYAALPLRNDNGRLVVAMADPFQIEAVTAVERAARRPIRVVAAPRDGITAMIARAYNGTHVPLPPAPRPEAGRPPVAPPAPAPSTPAHSMDDQGGESVNAAALAEAIIKRGVQLGATDVHIEPQEYETRVRYRVDGLLQDAGGYPKSVQAPLMSRIKILAGVDIAETRLPQDGRIRVTIDATQIDIRVSTYPTIYGEDVVLRLLDRSKTALNLNSLGIAEHDLALLRTTMRRPHGLIPVTGPTGSGKTTTLYSALSELNTRERCIITLEDPVEYELAEIRQSQINVRAGLTFASGLRSILRHDPDIILVGEIRDKDTLQIALSAALTGHLVLTTLHTTTAAGSIPRLIDMGAEPFVLASSMHLVISQRLVRLLCPNCKVEVDVPEIVRREHGLGDEPLFGPQGCTHCRQTGYRGRLGIFEFLPVDERLSRAIYERRTPEEIHSISGRPTMFDDGLGKVRAGLTSLDELLRVISA